MRLSCKANQRVSHLRRIFAMFFPALLRKRNFDGFLVASVDEQDPS